MTTPETRWHAPDGYEGTHAEALALAMERQRMADENPFSPPMPWESLTEHEREMSVLGAANYLTALRRITPRLDTPDRSELPYTCQYCRNTLADHLLVFDLHGADGVFMRRVTDLVCGPCGRFGEARNTSPHFKAVRLFRLTTALNGQQDGDGR